jgi:hypothetical protein
LHGRKETLRIVVLFGIFQKESSKTNIFLVSKHWTYGSCVETLLTYTLANSSHSSLLCLSECHRLYVCIAILLYNCSTHPIASQRLQFKCRVCSTKLTPKIPWDQNLVDCCLGSLCTEKLFFSQFFLLNEWTTYFTSFP